MQDIEKKLEEFYAVCDRLRNGEYDNANEEISKYKKLKRELDEARVLFLDGLDLETLIID